MDRASGQPGTAQAAWQAIARMLVGPAIARRSKRALERLVRDVRRDRSVALCRYLRRYGDLASGGGAGSGRGAGASHPGPTVDRQRAPGAIDAQAPQPRFRPLSGVSGAQPTASGLPDIAPVGDGASGDEGSPIARSASLTAQ